MAREIVKNGLSQQAIFEEAARRGAVVNKDEVAEAISKLEAFYDSVGVDHRKRVDIISELQRRFFGGDRLSQVAQGKHIIELSRTIFKQDK